MQGLMAGLARHHDVTAVSLITHDLTPPRPSEPCAAASKRARPGATGRKFTKRLGQLSALASPRSFERRIFDRPGLRRAVWRVLGSRRFDIAVVEFPFLANQRLDHAPDGAPPPLRVLDEHNIEFDLARQQATDEHGVLRHLHNAANWPKLRREEVHAFRTFDGVTFCSEADERRARPSSPRSARRWCPTPWTSRSSALLRTFRPRRPDADVLRGHQLLPQHGRSALPPEEIWPLVERTHPRARLKIVGQHPTAEILSCQGPRVEVTGRVDDVRPHLSSAAVTVVPLRIGGGTRFKILEAMAMARPVVSTSVGAEGIDARPGQDLLLADDPTSFAHAVGRVLDDPGLASTLGQQGRALVEARYSWDAAAQRLEEFFGELLDRRAGDGSPPRV
jgi:hypothetical protein